MDGQHVPLSSADGWAQPAVGGGRACFRRLTGKQGARYAGVAQEFTELEPSPRTTCAVGTL